jgi:hypothetical protein
MPDHIQNDEDHPSGSESARVLRDRRREARRHDCDTTNRDTPAEFERFRELAGRLVKTPKTEVDEKRKG